MKGIGEGEKEKEREIVKDLKEDVMSYFMKGKRKWKKDDYMDKEN